MWADNVTNLWDSVSGTQMVINNASGDVGIGTVTPTAKLEVTGRVSASVVQVNDDGAGCSAGTLGTIRRDPVSGKIQVCRL